MFKLENIFIKSNLKSYLKRYKLALILSFIIGLLIGSIPYINKTYKSFKIQKLMEEKRKMQIQKKSKVCKEKNSEYEKFLSLGFPKTAIEKFNICMQEK